MNAIVISLDCVRPEALSCYPETFSYHRRFPYRAETPNIDTIAADGLIFHNAICQAPFTPASHASLFTAQNPYQHGIRGMFSYELNGVETMAERFSAAGYDTGGFIGAHALSSRYGLNRGFDTYDEEFDEANKNWVVGNRRPCTEITDRALAWLTNRDREYLLFLHYFDAHDGGDVSTDKATQNGDIRSDSGNLRGIYDSIVRPVDEAVGSPVKRIYRALKRFDPDKNYGRRYHLQEVQRIDEQIGRVVEALQDRGEYDETAIVIVADHGDAFGEHGEYGHRKYIYDTTIRVPLLVKPAAGAGVNVSRGSVDGVVRLIDVYPTLAETAGINAGPVEGTSLYEAVADKDERWAYAETRQEESPENLHELVADFVCIRGDRWKLIQDLLDDSFELYDIENDPSESENVAEDYPEVRDDLAGELEGLVGDAPDKEAHLLTDAEQEAVHDHLEGLGYL